MEQIIHFDGIRVRELLEKGHGGRIFESEVNDEVVASVNKWLSSHPSFKILNRFVGTGVGQYLLITIWYEE